MNIRVVPPAEGALWDEYVLGHQQGLAYHRFGWLETVSNAYGFKVYPLLAEISGRVAGILPLAHIRSPLSRGELVSLPYCDLGGVLAESEEVAETLLDRARNLAVELSIPRVQIRSAVRLQQEDKAHPQKMRMVLELPESSEALLAGFQAKLRSQVKKPMRDGLTATLGGAELLDAFYKVFAENMRDLGSPVHSRRWFAELLARYGVSARIGLVFMSDGSPAAAGIILGHGRTVSIPWASSLRRFNRYNPNMLLYWSFLAYAADQGFALFDFGRSTRGEGTFKFKQQWGAEPRPLYWCTLGDVGNAADTNLRLSANRARVEAVWRRLPLPVCNVLGPRIRRFVSL
jgi:FemAB-related protein (PEP-CTERM system-associated)